MDAYMIIVPCSSTHFWTGVKSVCNPYVQTKFQNLSNININNLG